MRALEERFGRDALVGAARGVLTRLREELQTGLDAPGLDAALERIATALQQGLEDDLAPSLKPVVNATGILVHTNLGRAPLSARALDALSRVGRGYSNLELDLSNGKRGSRHQHAAHLLKRVFPGSDALVVNNAAAAVMLALNTCAVGREVVISRGELVEIGGSFRVPDILERSGAKLREVGTTNKTRIEDYAKALGPETGALLRVHPSNFRIVGFTETTATEALVALGESRGLPVIEDFGSGNVTDLSVYGVSGEPTAQQSVSSGVDVSIFSGDKLLGGPQAGILVGKPEFITACRKNPMARALRVDKLTYAALEATLLSFVEGKASEEIPILRMLSQSEETLAARSEALVAAVSDLKHLRVHVESSESRIGGGAAADAVVPTRVLVVTHEEQSAETLQRRLRSHAPPVLARISDDRVLLDLRTVSADEEPALRDALRALET